MSHSQQQTPQQQPSEQPSLCQGGCGFFGECRPRVEPARLPQGGVPPLGPREGRPSALPALPCAGSEATAGFCSVCWRGRQSQAQLAAAAPSPAPAASAAAVEAPAQPTVEEPPAEAPAAPQQAAADAASPEPAAAEKPDEDRPVQVGAAEFAGKAAPWGR